MTKTVTFEFLFGSGINALSASAVPPIAAGPVQGRERSMCATCRPEHLQRPSAGWGPRMPTVTTLTEVVPSATEDR